MSEPLVVAIMLVNGRESMVRRAVASFRAQSYPNSVLVVWDTGSPRVPVEQQPFDRVWWWTGCPKSIGAMRNDAIRWTLDGPTPHPEIFVTFDSDDASNEHRITEQVALLEVSGADCCGYYEAPFWDTRPGAFAGAWLYRDPARKEALGASLAFWRKTWERHPFDDINHGEDTRFYRRCKTVAVSAMKLGAMDVDPRICCGIHGSNTSPGYDFTKRQQCFKRAPEFDEYCQRAMMLE